MKSRKKERKTFRYIKAERIHFQYICTSRNIFKNSSGRRKIPEGNLDPCKGMINTRNGKYMGNITGIFFLP